MNAQSLSRMSAAGFVTIAVLIACSFVMVALGWELRKRLRSQSLDGDWLLVQIRYLLFDRQVGKERAREYLKQLNRPISLICAELLGLDNPTLASGDYLLTSSVEKMRIHLERGLSHLGTIAVIAPFVGLFGTVLGITKTFADVAKQGKAGIEVVSAGVSEALVATAIGLLVAIVSVVLFNSFKKSIDNEVSSWDITARNLLFLLTLAPENQGALFENPPGKYDNSSAQAFLGGEAETAESVTPNKEGK